MTIVLAIAVTNQSTVLSDEEVMTALPAFQWQANRHFAYDWHTGCRLHFASSTAIPHGMSHIAVLDDSDQAGALGYHDLDEFLAPDAFVFAKTDKDYDLSWTVTFSHELLEILGDQWISEGWQVGFDWYAQEVCDPVEADELGYTVEYPKGNKVLVSDFILPRWFMPDAPEWYDFKHHCTKPFEILPGGYAQIFKWGKGWTQIVNNGDTIVEKQFATGEDYRRPRPSQEIRRDYVKHKKEEK